MIGAGNGKLVCVTAAFAVMACVATAFAADKKVAGTIAGYECGDNCYLTIKTKAAGELTGLCAAKACTKWNEEVSMPSKFVGRRVMVTVGSGQQTDAEGNVMGDFPAFTEIVFVK